MSFTLSVSNPTKDKMNLLGLSNYPFTTEDLKVAFRTTVRQCHSDITGNTDDDNKTKRVISAYEDLKPIAIAGDGEINAFRATQSGDDLFSLTEVCPTCLGKCYTERYTERWENCPDCYPHPYKNLPYTVIGLKCYPCQGTGTFTQQSGRKVTCKKCGGNKIFYAKCRKCSGLGRVPHIEYIKDACRKCGGKGRIEITVLNPVIPKGAVLF